MPVVAVRLAPDGLGGRRAGVDGRLVGIVLRVTRGVGIVSIVGLRGVVGRVSLGGALAVPVVAVGLAPDGLGGRRAGVDGRGLVGILLGGSGLISLLGVVGRGLGGGGVLGGTGALTVPFCLTSAHLTRV